MPMFAVPRNRHRHWGLLDVISIQEFQSFSAYQIANFSCPAGHYHCQGSLGSIYNDWKAGIWLPDVYFETSYEESTPEHIHTIDKKIVVSAMRAAMGRGGGSSGPSGVCDILPTQCIPITQDYVAVSVGLQEGVTQIPTVQHFVGYGYYHRHWISNYSCYYDARNWGIITALGSCSLGHAGCVAITTPLDEELWVITGQLWKPMITDWVFDYEESHRRQLSLPV